MGIATHQTLVITPTLNERENVPTLVETVFGLYPDIHFVFVDDHSQDGTAQEVKRLRSRYPNLLLIERSGAASFGRSYLDGFAFALRQPWCQAVVTMDADFSHDPRVIRHLLSKLGEAGAVVGSRYVTGGSVKNWNLPRRALSRCANAYVRAVLGLKPRDTTAGFIAIGRDALERVPLGDIASDGYAFLVELKYVLVNSGVTIAEYPIQFDERREGQSKMSAEKIWESALLPWRIRFGPTRAARQQRLKRARSAAQGGQ